MMMIQVTDDKVNKMSGLCEEMLTIGGKLMHCLSGLGEESEMGERRMGMRDGGRYGMGMRDEEPMGMRGYGMRDDYDMGERRRRRY